MMENKDSYRDISIEGVGFSKRIIAWAKERGINNLYELIEAISEEELERLNAHVEPNISESFDERDADELDNVIQLTDEDGNNVAFEFLDLITYDNNDYVVLFPKDHEDDGEVVILKVEDGKLDEDEYVSVDDEEELMKVFNIFKEKNKNVFDFEE